MKRLLLLAAAAGVLAWSPPASAHTDADVIAVPAGAEATVTLKPTHGCAGSPTVEVAIQAPVEGATAGEVEGWTATATPDEGGKTVLEWTGGSLPADQEGEFPVTFLAPDAVGELLTFPAVQTCADGEELSWISGDPADDFPAPRLLILAPGSEPASTLEEVPADAPGRNQLTEIADVDNPAATSTTVPATTTSAPATTTSAPATTTASADAGADGGDGGTPLPVIAAIVLVIAAIAGCTSWYLRHRSERRVNPPPEP